MARAHHRKKHKEQLRQFKQREENIGSPATRTRASWVFAIIGAITGLAITYFGTNGQTLWLAVGIAGGSLAGYFAGRSMDRDRSK